MALTAGDALGPYEIVELIGSGGMGQVYRARDRRLHRDVAIKVSAARFSERFEREARAIAALNHPNICTLYDIGPNYLVLELVEGLTLADRLTDGPIPLDEALAIARQIAEALEAAHEHAVVHRDLKPANVKVRPDGMVKVLDFGLAKQTHSFAADELTRSIDVQATAVGTIMGTAAYMAPEQATGQPTDRRADIWAFGVMLHEMVTGTRLFGGQTTSEILAKVIAQDPNLGALPASVRAVVEKCLRKDPRKRWQWIGDVRLALEEGPAQADALAKSAGTRGLSRWALGATAIVCAAGFAAVSVLYLSQGPSSFPTTRFTVPIPGDAQEDARFDLSPDGRNLAIATVEAGRRGLWVRPLDELEARLLPGTEGAESPFWSPDSTQIGFFADGRLKRVPIAGGAPAIVAEIGAAFQGASWNSDGVIVFSSNGLKLVSSTGCAITPLETDDVQATSFPRFLPDERHLLFRGNRAKEEESGVFVGSLDGSLIQHVRRAFSNAAYASSPVERSSGFMMFSEGGSLMAQPFDPRGLRVEGDPFTVAESVAGDIGRADFSLSSEGALAYRSATAFQLTWVNRSGATLEALGPSGTQWAGGGALGTIRLSPDGTRVAYSRIQGEGGRENRDVWQLDLLRNVPERLTFAPGPDLVPVWSPDSREVVFASNRDRATGFDSYVVSRGGEERLLVEMPGNGWPLDWSPDGRVVLQLQGGSVWIVPTDGGAPQRYAQFSIEVARFAPNGRWVAYVSDESGQDDVYVRPFPGPGRAVRVSAAGGTQPQWRRNGSELFYVAGDGTLTAVPVTSSATAIQFGRPARLFPSAAGYQASADGQRFLIARPASPTGPAITVVLNWQGDLDR